MTDIPDGGRVILKDIGAESWEHPADRAALAALRRIPGFDEVLRRIFGFFGEKPVRLAFQANAVRVSEKQFGWVHAHYQDVLRTLDAPEHYPLFISQTPIVNAGAYGMDRPFIVLNSGAIRLLAEDEVVFLLGHELGHILSGHVLYRTMTVILLQLANIGYPIVGLAARAVLLGLLEWSRKSELSADRAGLLTVQSPETALRTSMRLAGGATPEESDLNEFLQQADEYREGGDVADAVFKVLNLLGTTHPFHTLRAAELRDWVEAGEYDRIIRGEYHRRSEPRTPYAEDLRAATQSYREDAKEVFDQVAEGARDAARKVRDAFAEALRNR
ncbi:MAG TPA: M48 family metallopeptidase [Longimicrobiales bacterium]|nr:M48 family metallopeptidase [Longimicrobiales bacterium]